jgi:hypothetical protein
VAVAVRGKRDEFKQPKIQFRPQWRPGPRRPAMVNGQVLSPSLRVEFSFCVMKTPTVVVTFDIECLSDLALIEALKMPCFKNEKLSV